MTIRSRFPHSETITHLSDTARNAGNTIFAVIDQAEAALDLPLKLLVWEEQGIVSVAAVKMSEIAARYGVTGMDQRIAAIDHALDALIDSVKENG